MKYKYKGKYKLNWGGTQIHPGEVVELDSLEGMDFRKFVPQFEFKLIGNEYVSTEVKVEEPVEETVAEPKKEKKKGGRKK